VFPSQTESIAIAHVGNIMNSFELRGELENEGSIFQTQSDTELLAHLMKRNGKLTTRDAIIAALKRLVGAYTYVLMTADKLYVALDSHGIRPLSIGKLGDSYVVASESCAFDMIGATFEREVIPGELITISEEGMTSTM